MLALHFTLPWHFWRSLSSSNGFSLAWGSVCARWLNFAFYASFVNFAFYASFVSFVFYASSMFFSKFTPIDELSLAWRALYTRGLIFVNNSFVLYTNWFFSFVTNTRYAYNLVFCLSLAFYAGLGSFWSCSTIPIANMSTCEVDLLLLLLLL